MNQPSRVSTCRPMIIGNGVGLADERARSDQREGQHDDRQHAPPRGAVAGVARHRDGQQHGDALEQQGGRHGAAQTALRVVGPDRPVGCPAGPAGCWPGRAGCSARLVRRISRHAGRQPGQRPPVAGRDHRPRDHHTGAGAAGLRGPIGAGLGQVDGQRDRFVHPGGGMHPARTEHPLGDVGQSVHRHGPRRGVDRHHHVVERVDQCLTDADGILVRHHRDHPDQSGERELLVQGQSPGRGRRAGLCAASTRIVGDVLTRSSRPGRGDGGETVLHRVGVQLLADPGAEERLDGRQRQRRVRGLVGTGQRQEDVGVHPTETPQVQPLPADREFPVQHGELTVEPGNCGVHLDRPLQQHLHGVRLLRADHRYRTGFDDPGLVAGDLGDGVAQVFGVVDADRGDRGDSGVDHVGRVPGAAETHLDHRDLDRGVGERRERHGGEHLELGQVHAAGRPAGRVDQVDVRRHVGVRVQVPLGVDRRAVQADPFGDQLQVRRGQPAGAQARAG